MAEIQSSHSKSASPIGRIRFIASFCAWTGIAACAALVLTLILAAGFAGLAKHFEFAFTSMFIIGLVLLAISIASGIYIKLIRFQHKGQPLGDLVENIGLYPSVILLVFVSAIAVPNVISALNRSKQKETMFSLAKDTAIIEYYKLTHEGKYPCNGRQGSLVTFKDCIGQNVERLRLKDGWGHDIYYSCAESGQEYFLIAPGKDGKITFSLRYQNGQDHRKFIESLGPCLFTDYNSDCVIYNAEVIRLPEGPTYTSFIIDMDKEGLEKLIQYESR